MPVAATFSKAFYERLGHDFVEELVAYLNRIDATYRSDLRELNELNFARFDAKLEQRMAELRVELEQRFSALEQRLAQLDGKLERRTAELRQEMGGLKAEMVKWMFLFWAGTVLPLIGVMLALRH